MIELFPTGSYADSKARRILELFNIQYIECPNSALAQSLGEYYSPIIRDAAGINYYRDAYFLSHILLYSLGETCPNCTMLEGKLREARIPFKKITDKEALTKNGFTHLPILRILGDGDAVIGEYGFKDSFKMIKRYIDEGGDPNEEEI